jgi:hypothetical protein
MASITPAAQRGRRARLVGDAGVGAAEEEDLEQFIKNDAVGDATPVTSERMGIGTERQKGNELVPERLDQA